MKKIRLENIIFLFFSLIFTILLFSSIFGFKTLLYENYSLLNKYVSNSFQIANGFCFYEVDEYREYLIENGANSQMKFNIDNDLTFSEIFFKKCEGRVTGLNTLDLKSKELTIQYVPGESNKIFSFFPLFTLIFITLFLGTIIFFKKLDIYELSYFKAPFLFFINIYILRLINTDENIVADILYTIEPRKTFFSIPVYLLIFLSTYLALNSKLIAYYFQIFLFIIFSGILFKIFYYLNFNIYIVLILSLLSFYFFFYKKLSIFFNQIKLNLILNNSNKFIFSMFFTYFLIYIFNKEFFCLDTDCEVYHYVIPKLIQSDISTVYFPFAEVGYGLSHAYTNLFAYTISFLQQVSKLDYLTIGYAFNTLVIFIFVLTVLLTLNILEISNYWFVFLMLIFFTIPTFAVFLMTGNYMFLLVSLFLLRICIIDSNRYLKFLVDICIFFIGPIGVLCTVLINLYEFNDLKINIIKGSFFGMLLLFINYLAGYPFLYPYTDMFIDPTNKLLYQSTLEHLKLSNQYHLEFYGLTVHNIFFGHPNILGFGVVCLIFSVIIILNNKRNKIRAYQLSLFFVFSYVSVLYILSYYFARYYLISNILIAIIIVGTLDIILKKISIKEVSLNLFIYISIVTIFAPTYNLEKNDHYISYEHSFLSNKKFDNYLVSSNKEMELATEFRHNYSKLASDLSNTLNAENYKIMFGDLRILNLDNLNNYNFLFSDVAYTSLKNGKSIWENVENLDIDFSIVAHWTYVEDYWPVLDKTNYSTTLEEETLYTFNVCGIDSEAFMLIDHKNQFQDLKNENFMRDFCWIQKPLKTYLKRVNSQ